MKYLTNSGLSYFLNKIKAYISSVLPTKTSDLTNDSNFIDSNNLKTINNNSLVGTGNITITANSVDWDNVNNKPSTFTPSSHTHSASDITSGLATVATSGSYNDLSNKPTIPTVNNATLTIQKNGTTVKTFTANASSNVTANITVPTKTSDLTNDSGFLTSSGSCNYANSAGTASSATTSTTAGAVNTSVAADNTKDLVYATMADSDAFRIRCGGNNNEGWAEIATSDDGNEPIYVRQYRWNGDTFPGSFDNIVRTLTLLDGSGNTQFPGTVTATTFTGNLNGNCSGTAGSVAWANVSGRPTAVSQFSNDSGYITTDGAAYPRRVGGVTMNFNWSGQGGQPTWLWGGEDGTNMYVYNPANFSVNYANSAGYTNWLRTSSHSDHLFHIEWDGSYFWTYVTAGDGGYRAVRVERSNSSGWADSAGGVAWNNVSGRPTALSQFTNDSGFITSGLPIGSYIQFAGSQAPEGFLVCNGGAISRTTYSALFAVIGTTYGSGDGWSTFNLPNLTDRFLQGSTTSGTVKNAGLPNITGYIRSPAGSATEQQGAFKTNNLASHVYGSGDLYFWNWYFAASHSNSIYGNSTTVQPPALTCLICIKY